MNHNSAFFDAIILKSVVSEIPKASLISNVCYKTVTFPEINMV